MSRENVEIVRRCMMPYEQEDSIPAMREFVDRVGPDFQPEAVLTYWAEDPAWQHMHPQIEWDSRVTGLLAAVRGPREVALWWADWLEVWESYVFQVLEYRDLGDWVLVPLDVQAQGRDGIAVQIQTFQLLQVRDGKVAVYRSFRTEQEALESLGLAD